MKNYNQIIHLFLTTKIMINLKKNDKGELVDVDFKFEAGSKPEDAVIQEISHEELLEMDFVLGVDISGSMNTRSLRDPKKHVMKKCLKKSSVCRYWPISMMMTV